MEKFRYMAKFRCMEPIVCIYTCVYNTFYIKQSKSFSLHEYYVYKQNPLTFKPRGCRENSCMYMYKYVYI